MNRSRFIRGTVLVTLLVMAVQAVWAFVMPPFRGPDEPHHVNSIFRLASGQGWPEPGEAMVDPIIMDASKEAGLLLPDSDSFKYWNRSSLYQGGIYGNSFALTIVTAHPNRTVIDSVDAVDPEATVRDQMVQHPPLYYAGGAAIVNILDLDEVPWDRALNVLRLYSILVASPLVFSMIYVARRLGAPREWALLAGFIPLAIPQLSAVSSTVTNDSMAIGAGGLAVAALVKAGTERITPTTVALVGGSVGLALWTKGQLLALGLPLILVFLLKSCESWKHRLTAVAGAGLLSQIICPWWVMNIVRYGAIQPDSFMRDPSYGWNPAKADAWEFISVAAQTMSESFVARFGWLEVNIPITLLHNLLIALVILTITGIVALTGVQRKVSLIALCAGPAIAAVIVAQSWSVYVETGQIAGVQGRYLYPFIAALAVIVFALKKWGRAGFLWGGLVALGYNVVGLVTLTYTSYYGEPVNFDRMALVIGFDRTKIVVLYLVYALAIAALAVMVWQISRSESVRHPARVEVRSGTAGGETRVGGDAVTGESDPDDRVGSIDDGDQGADEGDGGETAHDRLRGGELADRESNTHDR